VAEAELAGGEQACEADGVAAVGLHPVAGLAGDQTRRDDAQVEPAGASGASEREAGRAGFVTALQRLRQRLQPRDHFVAAATETRAAQLTACDVDRGGMRRVRVDIQTHVRHRFQHGRTSFVWGQPEPVSGQTNPRTHEVSGLQHARGYSAA
jgi:hypothetical protein